MMTSYFFGSSIRTPPTLTNSASTPFTFIELIFSTTAGGKVFSIPNKSPIFFTIHPSSSNCHPERSNCSAKQSNYEVEGSLFTCETLPVFKERGSEASEHGRNLSSRVAISLPHRHQENL